MFSWPVDPAIGTRLAIAGDFFDFFTASRLTLQPGFAMVGVNAAITEPGNGSSDIRSRATAGLCHAIIALMPPHDVHVESHLGSGAIMKRKPPAMRNIGIDRDWRSIEGFRADHPVELVHGCCHRFLSTFEADRDTLVHADPPYLASTRKAPDRYRYPRNTTQCKIEIPELELLTSNTGHCIREFVCI